MGRTLKRVALDFSWPLGKVWGGYINPFAQQSVSCGSCDGSGYSPEAKRFKDEWYGYAPFDPVAYGATPITIKHPEVQAFARRNCEGTPGYYGSSDRDIAREARRLFDLWKGQWSHHLTQADVAALLADGRLADFKGREPTAEEVNAWSLRGFGHDSINAYVCITARCAREGAPVDCAACDDGHAWPSEQIKEQAAAWESAEPPVGDGFQLWETTSEGSPTSPVFPTLDALCAWCAVHATTFGSNRASAAKWREMLDADFVVHREGNAIFL